MLDTPTQGALRTEDRPIRSRLRCWLEAPKLQASAQSPWRRLRSCRSRCEALAPSQPRQKCAVTTDLLHGCHAHPGRAADFPARGGKRAPELAARRGSSTAVIRPTFYRSVWIPVAGHLGDSGLVSRMAAFGHAAGSSSPRRRARRATPSSGDGGDRGRRGRWLRPSLSAGGSRGRLRAVVQRSAVRRPRALRGRGDPSAASGLRRSQSPPGFLNARQRSLRLRERTRTYIDARRLGRDRDLLAGRRVSALALLLRRLHADSELHHTRDPHLLRVSGSCR